MRRDVYDDANQLTSRVTRAVILSQIFFTAGHSITTGGFLNYFVYTFEPSAFMLAAVQIAPESSEAFSVFTRYFLSIVKSRKWLWVSSLTLGRIAALLIPIALFLDWPPQSSLVLILVSIASWHFFQGIAYCSYISWLSELVPEMNWGSFFAKRRIASLGVSIVVPIGVGLSRRKWIDGLDVAWKTRSYVIIFGIGAILVLCSILPMLAIPDRKFLTLTNESPNRVNLRDVFHNQFSWLLASRWWLSFFQGLTQAVIFKFSVDVLKIGLEEYYILLAVMLSLQIGGAAWAGNLCDRQRDLQLLIWSMLGVSFAMWFWWGAKPDAKYLAYGAYIVWGGFGIVNVALQNLTLKLAPLNDNTTHISLSRQGSGLIAGAAGLLGGFWLDQLLNNAQLSSTYAYQILFVLSWVGRATAVLWLLPIRQPLRNN